jgi:uncharacterized protein (DUF433 family)
MFPNISNHSWDSSGRPGIILTKLTIEFLPGLLADGASVEDIVSSYPQLTAGQVSEAILFAANSSL